MTENSVPSNLSLPHQQKLKDRYDIDPGHPLVSDLIQKGIIKSLNKENAKQLLNRDDFESGGIYIGYPNNPGCFTVRLNNPLTDKNDGKQRKYLKPSGQINSLYIPPNINFNLLDEIWITEGELKALCGATKGLPLVALSGVWNWRSDKNDVKSNTEKFFAGSKTSGISDKNALIQDLDFNWSGKRIILLYDSDISRAHPAWPSFGRLAEELYTRGADSVKVFTLPQLSGEKKIGIDDLFLEAKQAGVDEIRVIEHLGELINRQEIWLPLSERASLSYGESVKRKKTTVSMPTHEEKARATASILSVYGEAAAKEYASFFGTGKSTLLNDAKKLLKVARNKQKMTIPKVVSISNLKGTIDSLLYSYQKSDDKPPREVFRNELFEVIKSSFLNAGCFYKSNELDGMVWWFYEKEYKMFSYNDLEFQTFFTEVTGQSLKSELGKDSFEKLYAFSYQNAAKVNVNYVSYYDSKRNLLYIDMFNGKMVRLDGTKVEIVPLGTDNVFFLHETSWASWAYCNRVTDSHLDLYEQLTVGANFSTTSPLSPQNAKIVVKAWKLASFFRSKLPTKPYLFFSGKKGSGKTSIARYWLKLIFGPSIDVTAINPQKSEQFETIITNQPWVCIDNLDGSVKNIEDILATASTGGNVSKRMLFFTNKLVSYPIVSWFMITSRTPRFRRDDLADRLAVIELDELKSNRPEGDTLKSLYENRNELLSILINELNELIGYFNCHGWSKQPENFRMADFASFTRSYLRYCLGNTEGDTITNEIIEQLKISQHKFVVEDDYLVDLLQVSISKGNIEVGRPYRLDEILTTLKKEADLKRINFNINNKRALSQIFRERKEAINTTQGLVITEGNSKGYPTFSFQPKDDN